MNGFKEGLDKVMENYSVCGTSISGSQEIPGCWKVDGGENSIGMLSAFAPMAAASHCGIKKLGQEMFGLAQTNYFLTLNVLMML